MCLNEEEQLLNETHTLIRSGQFDRARVEIEVWLARFPTSPRLWFFSGVVFDHLTQYDEAKNSFSRAIVYDPKNANFKLALSTVLSKMGNFQDVLPHLESVVTDYPDVADYWVHLGTAYFQVAKFNKAKHFFPKAEQAYFKALSINQQHRNAWLNLSVLSLELGLIPLTIKQTDLALKFFPDDAGLLNNRIEALIQAFDYGQASRFCIYALSKHPKNEDYLYKLAFIDAARGELSLAANTLNRLYQSNPKRLEEYHLPIRGLEENVDFLSMASWLRLKAWYAQQERCYWKHRNDFSQALTQLDISTHQHYQHTILANLTSVPAITLALSSQQRRSIAEKVASSIPKTTQVETQNRDGSKQRIRIGYLSPDFKMQAVGHLADGLFALHNQNNFEVFGYSICKNKDSKTQAYSSQFEHFYQLDELSDADLIAYIRDHSLDILIDLAGFTSDARPAILAARVAPIQMHYLGFPGTTGAEFIDYFIVDDVVAPLGSESAWSEKLWRLPQAYIPYDTRISNSSCIWSRADFRLPDDAFVMCAFNNTFKLEPDIMRSWFNVMKRVKQAVLWLVVDHPMARENILQFATEAGIDRSRLIFSETLGIDQHLPRYKLADIFVDTYWHNAHTTAMDVLWQGLPIATIKGEVPSSRLAASVLTTLGLPELIADSFASYENIICDLAESPQKLQAIRNRLIERRESSKLFQPVTLIRALEVAYCQVMENHQLTDDIVSHH